MKGNWKQRKMPVAPNNINEEIKEHKMFYSMFKKSFGQKIWSYLTDELTMIRMIDAANLKRASVDPLSKEIDAIFKISSKNDKNKWKQYVGYMIKFIMRKNDYIHDARDIKVISGGLFTKASRYKLDKK